MANRLKNIYFHPEIMNNPTGILRKLKSEFHDPIKYYLSLGDNEIYLNDLIEKKISLRFQGNIYCIQCGRKTQKSFQQGYCFPCLRRLQECNLCIIHPERCQVEQGTCPEDDWAHRQCYRTHIVYLSVASGLKVGITRETQVPTRWIDQGAVQALPIFQTSNRYQAGVIEVALKAFVADKTNWRNMLKNQIAEVDLFTAKRDLMLQANKKLNNVIAAFKTDAILPLNTQDLLKLNYPVLQYPQKITSLSFDKTTTVAGQLLGIKGQYLLFDTGVINIRKFGGYEITYQVE